MEHKQALTAADALMEQSPADIYTSVVYQYGRGCYAIIVYGKEDTVVLVNEDALMTYRAIRISGGAD